MAAGSKHRYSYSGAVRNQYGSELHSNFTARTYAVSSKKAASNILAQYKRLNGLEVGAKLELDEKNIKLEII